MPVVFLADFGVHSNDRIFDAYKITLKYFNILLIK